MKNISSMNLSVIFTDQLQKLLLIVLFAFASCQKEDNNNTIDPFAKKKEERKEILIIDEAPDPDQQIIDYDESIFEKADLTMKNKNSKSTYRTGQTQARLDRIQERYRDMNTRRSKRYSTMYEKVNYIYGPENIDVSRFRVEQRDDSHYLLNTPSYWDAWVDAFVKDMEEYGFLSVSCMRQKVEIFKNIANSSEYGKWRIKFMSDDWFDENRGGDKMGSCYTRFVRCGGNVWRATGDRIVINIKDWRKFDEATRWTLLYHELGHAFLGWLTSSTALQGRSHVSHNSRPIIMRANNPKFKKSISFLTRRADLFRQFHELNYGHQGDGQPLNWNQLSVYWSLSTGGNRKMF